MMLVSILNNRVTCICKQRVSSAISSCYTDGLLPWKLIFDRKYSENLAWLHIYSVSLLYRLLLVYNIITCTNNALSDIITLSQEYEIDQKLGIKVYFIITIHTTKNRVLWIMCKLFYFVIVWISWQVRVFLLHIKITKQHWIRSTNEQIWKF